MVITAQKLQDLYKKIRKYFINKCLCTYTSAKILGYKIFNLNNSSFTYQVGNLLELSRVVILISTYAIKLITHYILHKLPSKFTVSILTLALYFHILQSWLIHKLIGNVLHTFHVNAQNFKVKLIKLIKHNIKPMPL